MSRVFVVEPTVKKFLDAGYGDGLFIIGLMGPVGTGKTTAMVKKVWDFCENQEPNKSGIRPTRWMWVRNTYGELESTTIHEFKEWIPEGTEEKWINKEPYQCKIKRWHPSGDGTQVESDHIFVSMDRPEHFKKVKSLNVTGVVLNEASELVEEVFLGSFARQSRYPPMSDVRPTWGGVLLDTNPPDETHWIFKLFEKNKPNGVKLFRQPAALTKLENGDWVANPRAEGVRFHRDGYGYWLNLASVYGDDWAKIYIQGEYGMLASDQAMYPEYEDSKHCAEESIRPLPGVPLILGWDFGLTPACVVCQLTPLGQFTVITEMVSSDMGIIQFAKEMVLPWLRSQGIHTQGLVSVGDPAGAKRSETNERTCFMELDDLGIYTVGAATNELTARRESVAKLLLRNIQGGLPAFQISPEASVLRAGFIHGYRRKRINMPGEKRFKDKPDKNAYSHIHDALQYAAMHVSDIATVSGGVDIKPDPKVQSDLEGYM